MKTIKKPWGDFKEFTYNENSTVKILNIRPGSAISLQKHRHRKEMWYFLTPGFVQIGEKKKRIPEGGVIMIGKGILHRLYAKSRPVRVLEISFGRFDENDIIRMEDRYNRV